ncbi:MAG TPA: DUF1684 domain-containing protein [Vicinamibacterales bacterium]
MTRLACALALSCLLAACGRGAWPQPPAVDAATYQKQYAEWHDEQQHVGDILAIVGVWSLPEGETPFGSDKTLPIVLPASAAPERAGVFQRKGDAVTIVPAPRSTVHLEDGTSVTAPTTYAEGMTVGSVLLAMEALPDGRVFVTGIDQAHPAMKQPPSVDAFPPDQRWRVAARFDAFDTPRPVKVPDVRGGTVDFTAAGQLVFRLADREWRLTAFDAGADAPFFVMFKDRTNGTTTYGGYRIVGPNRVKNGEFTVLDFNMAMNPPCAYSPFTTCPLPPPENKLDIAVEAGLKRLASVQGFVASE